jgi:hypothetical protein
MAEAIGYESDAAFGLRPNATGKQRLGTVAQREKIRAICA